MSSFFDIALIQGNHQYPNTFEMVLPNDILSSCRSSPNPLYLCVLETRGGLRGCLHERRLGGHFLTPQTVPGRQRRYVQARKEVIAAAYIPRVPPLSDHPIVVR